MDSPRGRPLKQTRKRHGPLNLRLYQYFVDYLCTGALPQPSDLQGAGFKCVAQFPFRMQEKFMAWATKMCYDGESGYLVHKKSKKFIIPEEKFEEAIRQAHLTDFEELERQARLASGDCDESNFPKKSQGGPSHNGLSVTMKNLQTVYTFGRRAFGMSAEHVKNVLLKCEHRKGGCGRLKRSSSVEDSILDTAAGGDAIVSDGLFQDSDENDDPFENSNPPPLIACPGTSQGNRDGLIHNPTTDADCTQSNSDSCTQNPALCTPCSVDPIVPDPLPLVKELGSERPAASGESVSNQPGPADVTRVIDGVTCTRTTLDGVTFYEYDTPLKGLGLEDSKPKTPSSSAKKRRKPREDDEDYVPNNWRRAHYSGHIPVTRRASTHSMSDEDRSPYDKPSSGKKYPHFEPISSADSEEELGHIPYFSGERKQPSSLASRHNLGGDCPVNRPQFSQSDIAYYGGNAVQIPRRRGRRRRLLGTSGKPRASSSLGSASSLTSTDVSDTVGSNRSLQDLTQLENSGNLRFQSEVGFEPVTSSKLNSKLAISDVASMDQEQNDMTVLDLSSKKPQLVNRNGKLVLARDSSLYVKTEKVEVGETISLGEDQKLQTEVLPKGVYSVKEEPQMNFGCQDQGNHGNGTDIAESKLEDLDDFLEEPTLLAHTGKDTNDEREVQSPREVSEQHEPSKRKSPFPGERSQGDGPFLGEQPEPNERDGPLSAQQPEQIDEDGLFLGEQPGDNPILEERPVRIRGESPFVEEQLGKIEGDSPFLEEQPESVEGNSPFLGEQPEPNEGDSPFLGEQPASNEGNSPFLGEQSESIEERSPFLGEQPESVEGDSPFLGEQPEPIEGSSPFLEEQPEQIEGDSPFLGEPPESVEGTGPFLEEQLEKIEGDSPFLGEQPEPVEGSSPFLEEQPEQIEGDRPFLEEQRVISEADSPFLGEQFNLSEEDSLFDERIGVDEGSSPFLEDRPNSGGENSPVCRRELYGDISPVLGEQPILGEESPLCGEKSCSDVSSPLPQEQAEPNGTCSLSAQQPRRSTTCHDDTESETDIVEDNMYPGRPDTRPEHPQEDFTSRIDHFLGQSSVPHRGLDAGYIDDQVESVRLRRSERLRNEMSGVKGVPVVGSESASSFFSKREKKDRKITGGRFYSTEIIDSLKLRLRIPSSRMQINEEGQARKKSKRVALRSDSTEHDGQTKIRIKREFVPVSSTVVGNKESETGKQESETKQSKHSALRSDSTENDGQTKIRIRREFVPLSSIVFGDKESETGKQKSEARRRKWKRRALYENEGKLVFDSPIESGSVEDTSGVEGRIIGGSPVEGVDVSLDSGKSDASPQSLFGHFKVVEGKLVRFGLGAKSPQLAKSAVPVTPTKSDSNFASCSPMSDVGSLSTACRPRCQSRGRVKDVIGAPIQPMTVSEEPVDQESPQKQNDIGILKPSESNSSLRVASCTSNRLVVSRGCSEDALSAGALFKANEEDKVLRETEERSPVKVVLAKSDSLLPVSRSSRWNQIGALAKGSFSRAQTSTGMTGPQSAIGKATQSNDSRGTYYRRQDANSMKKLLDNSATYVAVAKLPDGNYYLQKPLTAYRTILPKGNTPPPKDQAELDQAHEKKEEKRKPIMIKIVKEDAKPQEMCGSNGQSAIETDNPPVVRFRLVDKTGRQRDVNVPSKPVQVPLTVSQPAKNTKEGKIQDNVPSKPVRVPLTVSAQPVKNTEEGTVQDKVTRESGSRKLNRGPCPEDLVPIESSDAPEIEKTGTKLAKKPRIRPPTVNDLLAMAKQQETDPSIMSKGNGHALVKVDKEAAARNENLKILIKSETRLVGDETRRRVWTVKPHYGKEQRLSFVKCPEIVENSGGTQGKNVEKAERVRTTQTKDDRVKLSSGRPAEVKISKSPTTINPEHITKVLLKVKGERGMEYSVKDKVVSKLVPETATGLRMTQTKDDQGKLPPGRQAEVKISKSPTTINPEHIAKKLLKVKGERGMEYCVKDKVVSKLVPETAVTGLRTAQMKDDRGKLSPGRQAEVKISKSPTSINPEHIAKKLLKVKGERGMEYCVEDKVVSKLVPETAVTGLRTAQMKDDRGKLSPGRQAEVKISKSPTSINPEHIAKKLLKVKGERGMEYCIKDKEVSKLETAATGGEGADVSKWKNGNVKPGSAKDGQKEDVIPIMAIVRPQQSPGTKSENSSMNGKGRSSSVDEERSCKPEKSTSPSCWRQIQDEEKILASKLVAMEKLRAAAAANTTNIAGTDGASSKGQSSRVVSSLGRQDFTRRRRDTALSGPWKNERQVSLPSTSSNRNCGDGKTLVDYQRRKVEMMYTKKRMLEMQLEISKMKFDQLEAKRRLMRKYQEISANFYSGKTVRSIPSTRDRTNRCFYVTNTAPIPSSSLGKVQAPRTSTTTSLPSDNTEKHIPLKKRKLGRKTVNVPDVVLTRRHGDLQKTVSEGSRGRHKHRIPSSTITRAEAVASSNGATPPNQLNSASGFRVSSAQSQPAQQMRQIPVHVPVDPRGPSNEGRNIVSHAAAEIVASSNRSTPPNQLNSASGFRVSSAQSGLARQTRQITVPVDPRGPSSEGRNQNVVLHAEAAAGQTSHAPVSQDLSQPHEKPKTPPASTGINSNGKVKKKRRRKKIRIMVKKNPVPIAQLPLPMSTKINNMILGRQLNPATIPVPSAGTSQLQPDPRIANYVTPTKTRPGRSFPTMEQMPTQLTQMYAWNEHLYRPQTTQNVPNPDYHPHIVSSRTPDAPGPDAVHLNVDADLYKRQFVRNSTKAYSAMGPASALDYSRAPAFGTFYSNDQQQEISCQGTPGGILKKQPAPDGSDSYDWLINTISEVRNFIRPATAGRHYSLDLLGKVLLPRASKHIQNCKKFVEKELKKAGKDK